MIQVTITDPGSCDPREMKCLTDYLTAAAQACRAPARIAPEDNPAAGAPNRLDVAQPEYVAPTPPPPTVPVSAAPVTAADAFRPKSPAPAPDALSTAAAVAPPTAPAAPMPTLTNSAPAPVPPAPMPASVAPPVAPPIPAPAPSAGVMVDAQGLPWDARIHSSSKECVADGSWRKRRNTAPELVTAVEAELRATMSAPAVTSPSLGSVLAAVLPAELSAALVPPPAPPKPPTPTATPSPETTPNTAVSDAAGVVQAFQGLMQRVVTAQTERRIEQAQVAELLGGFGLLSLPSLLSRPDLVPAVSDAFTAVGV